jgi:hypothetical protein
MSSKVLTFTTAWAPEFDGSDGELKTSLLIFSTPRTGSQTLCRLLYEVGLGVPAEYFLRHLIDQYRERFSIGTPDAVSFICEDLANLEKLKDLLQSVGVDRSKSEIRDMLGKWPRYSRNQPLIRAISQRFGPQIMGRWAELSANPRLAASMISRFVSAENHLFDQGQCGRSLPVSRYSARVGCFHFPCSLRIALLHLRNPFSSGISIG